MWKLAFVGIFSLGLLGSMPVSKTYYSDHVYVKYIPRIMFASEKRKQEEYLKSIDISRKDKYARVLYSRNYHRLLPLKRPLCTVVGDYVCGHRVEWSSSEQISKFFSGDRDETE